MLASGPFFKDLGVGWQLGSFIFLFVGFIISFILARRETIKLQKYWDRCREMSHKFSDEMLSCTAKGDFESAKSFARRGEKILGLWDRSLKTGSVPKEPDLDDL
jgi:hypothetical protein